MRSSDMPLQIVDRHIAEHTRIVEEITQINVDAMNRLGTRVRDIGNLATQWILEHFADFDREIRNYAT